jgi:capsular exopolysaccharide synthesis family protein
MQPQSQEALGDPGTMAAADAVHAALRFLRVLRFRMSYVVTAVAVTSLLGALYYFTATRVYEASASLLVNQTGGDVFNATTTSTSTADMFIPTYEKLFTSAVVLEGAIEDLNKQPIAARVDLAEIPREKWVDTLRANLTARGARRTSVIEISYRSKSPKAAVSVVTAIVNSYIKFVEKTHKDVSVELVKLLDNERQETAKKLADQQHQLLLIKRRAGVVVRDGAEIIHPLVQRVIELNKTLVEIQKNRLQLEATLTAVRDAIRNGGDLREHLISVEPNVGQEMLMSALGLNPQYAEVAGQVERQLLEERAKLETLRKHYGPTHPEILRLKQTIQNSETYLTEYQANVSNRLNQTNQSQLGPMLQSFVEEKLAKTWEHEKKLAEQYTIAESEAIKLNDCMAELQMAENEEQRLRNLHDTLLDRIANIDLKRDRADVQVSIVSEPTASLRPVSPRLSLIGALCLISGLGIGICVVYVIDLLDDRFRSPEELTEQTGVPLLAMIRKLAVSPADGAASIHMHAAPTTVETEAFRTLRTTLAFAGQEMQRVSVTSSEPGDGKTTVISNLAVSFAQAGKRTLLIDADMRKPGLSKLFKVRGLGGLSDVLRSDEDLAAMCQQRVRETGVEGLCILPCGPKPADPAELLSDSRFSDLLAWAETQYDQVLIDCPPVMAATDAAIIGRIVDGMLMVVQPEKNHRRLVLRAVENLLSVQANLRGIVANRVGDEKEGGYYGYGSGYGYGYGYGYGHGYGQEDDASSGDEPSSDEQHTEPASPKVRRRAA